MDRLENFWEKLRQLARSDSSVDVPETTHNKALSIFPSRQETKSKYIFLLSPANLAAVRKAGSNRKYFYELGNSIVQLEQANQETGSRLSGFVHGIEDGPVTLYGDECVFQKSISNGEFLFESVPFGSYRVCFSHEGECSWITDLRLNQVTDS